MNNSFRTNYIFHITGWLLYTAIYLFLFLDFLTLKGSLIRLLWTIPIQAVIFYMNAWFLMPRFLEKGKYFKYAFSILLIIGLLIGFSATFPIQKDNHRRHLMDKMMKKSATIPEGLVAKDQFNPKTELRNRSVFGRNLMQGFTLLSILFFSTIYRNAIVKKEKEKDEAILESNKLQADLQFLKAQINPHFLFNALNNIYSLALLKKDKAPDAIHELSEMLRYVIYESEDRFVSLEKEIKYVKNYIDLQLIKDQSITTVSFSYPENIKHCHIAPMILIPFVENSFKHSNIESAPNGWININLKYYGKNLIFTCSNSIPTREIKKDKTGGIGLENVKKRLKLIYKDNHSLNIQKENNTFKVILNIPVYDHKVFNS